ncbi:hypothetical protein D3C74_438290 [compost metagenome]
MPHDNCLQNRIFIVLKMILLQHSHTFARSHMHVPGVGFNLSGQDLQKSRFTGTVRPDQAVAVSWCEFYVYIFK